ncbi:MAG: GAF domain-containing protein [Gammaproteobacteria bacterium]|nr:GAF domain-containing protein [Gammaproteobacteria bacterium]
MRQIFCHWLDRYGGILFSRNNLCVWAALSPELEKEVVDISGALIRLKESPTGGKIEDTRDGIALKGFLGLFPGGRTSANHSELPKGWRKCMKKNQEFRNGIARIAHHLTPVPIGLEWLEHSMRDLEQYAPKLPVVDKFEDAWRHAWLKELGRLRAEVAVEEQVPLLGFEEAAEPVKRFFQAMRDVGFGRGRFYRIIRIPGCDGILKLTYAQGGLQEGHTLPVQHLLTGFLARQIRKYRQTDKPDTKRLISSIHSRSDVDRQDEGISFWDKIIHRNSREVWMEVPVLHQQTEKEYYPIAMFAFDLPGEDELQEAKKQLKFNVPGLRPILNDVVQIVALGARKREQEWHSHLSVLDKRLFSEVDRQAIEKTLLTAAVEISGASDGLLVTHEGAADELTIRAVAGSLQTFLDRVYFSLDEDFYPVVRCWKSRKALYIPNWVQSDLRHSVLKHTDFKGLSPEAPEGFQKWLEEGFGSLVAMPIWSGDKMVGAISLQSASAYSFDLERVRMLESLLQRVRWFLHTAELSDQRRMWERAFVHEIRSDLSPVSKAIEEALLADSDETEWPLTEAKRHCQGLLDLSQNFMDIQANPQADKCLVFTDPGTILSEYLDLYDTLIEQAEQQIEIHPHPDAEIWQYRLLGSREVFARVLRNILDNALKYGEEGAVIRINASLMKGMWLLAMSNPGWMTAEEDALKFRAYEKPNHVRYSGSHVGLAASRIWIHAYGGELKLDNIEEKGDKRVRALLRWPLAEK